MTHSEHCGPLSKAVFHVSVLMTP